MSNGITLGQFGTFDIGNYGDLLYPVLFEKLLRKRGVDAEVRRFSFMAAKSTMGSGYKTEPIRSLLSPNPEPPLNLIVGGGDLLRTDWDMVASHYRSAQSSQGGSTLVAKWRRLVSRLFGRGRRMDRLFRRRCMDYAAPGPFMIDPCNFPGIASLAYCSCGVPSHFEIPARAEVARTIDNAAFVYVRDRQSERKLREAGVKREVHVAPDLAVMLGELFEAAAEREKGRQILKAAGVDIDRQVLCVQSNPQRRNRHRELFEQLKAYQARTGCSVVLLPLGWCHGDDSYLMQLARESRGTFRCIESKSIFKTMAVIAASDVFMGKSLHGNITAFAFGIPHLIGPISAEKCDGFLDMAGLPRDLKLDSWREAGQKLDFVSTLRSDFFAERACVARQQVNVVFDRLVQVVAEPVAA